MLDDVMAADSFGYRATYGHVQGRCWFSMTCDVHEHHVASGGEWRDWDLLSKQDYVYNYHVPFPPLVNRTANHPPNYGLKPCFLLRLQKYDFLKIEHRKSINILLFILLLSFSSGMILGLKGIHIYIYAHFDIYPNLTLVIYIYIIPF